MYKALDQAFHLLTAFVPSALYYRFKLPNNAASEEKTRRRAHAMRFYMQLLPLAIVYLPLQLLDKGKVISALHLLSVYNYARAFVASSRAHTHEDVTQYAQTMQLLYPKLFLALASGVTEEQSAEDVLYGPKTHQTRFHYAQQVERYGVLEDLAVPMEFFHKLAIRGPYTRTNGRPSTLARDLVLQLARQEHFEFAQRVGVPETSRPPLTEAEPFGEGKPHRVAETALPEELIARMAAQMPGFSLPNSGLPLGTMGQHILFTRISALGTRFAGGLALVRLVPYTGVYIPVADDQGAARRARLVASACDYGRPRYEFVRLRSGAKHHAEKYARLIFLFDGETGPLARNLWAFAAVLEADMDKDANDLFDLIGYRRHHYARFAVFPVADISSPVMLLPDLSLVQLQSRQLPTTIPVEEPEFKGWLPFEMHPAPMLPRWCLVELAKAVREKEEAEAAIRAEGGEEEEAPSSSAPPLSPAPRTSSRLHFASPTREALLADLCDLLEGEEREAVESMNDIVPEDADFMFQ